MKEDFYIWKTQTIFLETILLCTQVLIKDAKNQCCLVWLENNYAQKFRTFSFTLSGSICQIGQIVWPVIANIFSYNSTTAAQFYMAGKPCVKLTWRRTLHGNKGLNIPRDETPERHEPLLCRHKPPRFATQTKQLHYADQASIMQTVPLLCSDSERAFTIQNVVALA